MEEETKTKRKPKLIPVKVVRANEDNALIEYLFGGLLQRVTIPVDEIHDGKAADDVVMAGLPYGVPWEMMKLSASPIMLANALRNNGIWTYEDAIRNPRGIVSALQAAYGVDLAALLEYARDNK